MMQSVIDSCLPPCLTLFALGTSLPWLAGLAAFTVYFWMPAVDRRLESLKLPPQVHPWHRLLMRVVSQAVCAGVSCGLCALYAHLLLAFLRWAIL